MGITPWSQRPNFDPIQASHVHVHAVGYLLIGLPAQSHARALQIALTDAGCAFGATKHFTPVQALTWLSAMDIYPRRETGLASEHELVRRCIELAQEGHHWLVVKVDAADDVVSLGYIAQACDASVAVHYRHQSVEQMI